MADKLSDREIVERLGEWLKIKLKEGRARYGAARYKFEEGRLIELSLAGRGLTTLPFELFQLTSLKILNLNGNLLTFLPHDITQLVNLEKLNLSNNQLTTLPPELGYLPNLNWRNNKRLHERPSESLPKKIP